MFFPHVLADVTCYLFIFNSTDRLHVGGGGSTKIISKEINRNNVQTTVTGKRTGNGYAKFIYTYICIWILLPHNI